MYYYMYIYACIRTLYDVHILCVILYIIKDLYTSKVNCVKQKKSTTDLCFPYRTIV